MTSRMAWSIGAVAAVYGLLTIVLILTQRPGADEAWFSGPGYNLAFHGYMGTPAIEPTTVYRDGRNYFDIDRHTYWILPLSPLLHALWFRVLGFSLDIMRSRSLAFGFAALLAWIFVLRKFGMADRHLVLAAILIGLDFSFLRGASNGRMDIMCAALNALAFAAYLGLREARLNTAVLVSCALVALSLLTHPNGAFGAVGLLLLAWTYDRHNLRFSHAGIAALPFVAGAAGWGLYIAQAPDAFSLQFRGMAQGRLGGFRDPWGALVSEITVRYAPGSGWIAWLRALQAAPYALGLALAAATPEIRRHPGYRALLCLGACEIIYLWLFEGTKLYLYLIHVSSVCMLLLAAAVTSSSGISAKAPRWTLRAALAGWLLLQVGGVAYVARRNDRAASFLPASAYLKSHAAPSAIIMGSPELAFELGFSDRLVDDVKLGFVSGKQPAYVVVERRYEEWFDYARQQEPATFRHIQALLNERLAVVYDQAGYKIYARRAAENLSQR